MAWNFLKSEMLACLFQAFAFENGGEVKLW